MLYKIQNVFPVMHATNIISSLVYGSGFVIIAHI